MNSIIKSIKGIDDIDLKDFQDINKYPSIDIPDLLTDIFLLDQIDEEYREKKFNYYKYNNIGVPRTTEILSQCINNEFLINWAAKLGKEKYYYEKNKATTIGTRTHEMIESFLLTGKYDNSIAYKTSPSILKNVNIAFDNFKFWINKLADNNYFITDIIAIEKQITCPYFGGTVDCICKINGATYIIDFKTSKQLNFEYILQVCAYLWCINSGYCLDLPHIDGVGLIRIDKEVKNKCDELFLNLYIPWQKEIIDKYISNFGILLENFYHIKAMEKEFHSIKKKTNLYETLENNGKV